jgi:hypothetical protein
MLSKLKTKRVRKIESVVVAFHLKDNSLWEVVLMVVYNFGKQKGKVFIDQVFLSITLIKLIKRSAVLECLEIKRDY